MVTINEKKGDLFASEDSLAHCVSADLKMGKGIACRFKALFGGVDELKTQDVKKGGCGFLKRENRYVFYLVTKDRYWHKPTYDTLLQSLFAMREHCRTHNITQLSMPRIGCGLDRLRWEQVLELIHHVFEKEAMTITIYTIL